MFLTGAVAAVVCESWADSGSWCDDPASSTLLLFTRYTSYAAHYYEANCHRLATEELLYSYGVDLVLNGEEQEVWADVHGGKKRVSHWTWHRGIA